MQPTVTATLQVIADTFDAQTVDITYHRLVSGRSFYTVTALGVQLPLEEGPGFGALSAFVDVLDLQTIIDALAANREFRQREFATRAALCAIRAA